MKVMTDDMKLNKNNVLFSVEKMPNTELRYRFKIDDNTIYSVTKSGENFEWQNSHYHKFCNEVYVVQSGKIIMVTKKDKCVIKKVAKTGDVIAVGQNEPHNLFLSKDAQICVLKYGNIKSDDWYSDKSLDEFCKSIDVEKIFEKYSKM